MKSVECFVIRDGRKDKYYDELASSINDDGPIYFGLAMATLYPYKESAQYEINRVGLKNVSIIPVKVEVQKGQNE